MSKIRPQPTRVVGPGTRSLIHIKRKELRSCPRCKAGFSVVRTRGSHVILENTVSGRIAVVPVHGSKDIPRPTLRNIVVRQAGLTEDEYIGL